MPPQGRGEILVRAGAGAVARVGPANCPQTRLKTVEVRGKATFGPRSFFERRGSPRDSIQKWLLVLVQGSPSHSGPEIEHEPDTMGVGTIFGELEPVAEDL